MVKTSDRIEGLSVHVVQRGNLSLKAVGEGPAGNPLLL